uniref:Ctr_53_N conopeptide n=1 Tax=Conus tribblei TaxID=101761 RepID=A0A0C9RYI9_CONTD
MKLSVMFIVFLMLAMPMTNGAVSPRGWNGGKAYALARDRAAKSLALLKKSGCPNDCQSCTNCCKNCR